MAPPKKAARTAKRAAVPAKAIPTKAAAQATITLKHLAATLANSHDLARKQAQAVLGDLVTLATRHFKRGDKIRLTGLGILRVRKRAEPRAREAVKIKASKKIAFRPAKELKGAVKHEPRARLDDDPPDGCRQRRQIVVGRCRRRRIMENRPVRSSKSSR